MKIGIDIGGSHIGVVLVDKDKIIIKRERDLIKEKGEQKIKEKIISTIKKYINEILVEANLTIKEIEMIGIAVPGAVKNNILISACNLGLYNFDIEYELKKEFDTKIILTNDAKCAAICEKEYGSIKKYKNAVYMCVGTGIGGVVFLNDKMLEHSIFPFEIGHVVIQKNGIECNCGKKGCFERYASIKQFKKMVCKELKIEENIYGEKIVELIKANEEKLEKIIEEYIENLAVGITNIIDLCNPEVITIGGSFAYYKDILLDKLIYKIEEYNRHTKIILAEYKNDAGIIGATC